MKVKSKWKKGERNNVEQTSERNGKGIRETRRNKLKISNDNETEERGWEIKIWRKSFPSEFHQTFTQSYICTYNESCTHTYKISEVKENTNIWVNPNFFKCSSCVQFPSPKCICKNICVNLTANNCLFLKTISIDSV